MLSKVWHWIVDTLAEQVFWASVGLSGHLISRWFFKKGKGLTMLEGKEFETNLGNVGTAYVDVKPDASAEMGASIDLEKELTKGVKVKLKVEALAEVDAIDLLVAQASKSSNSVLKFLAEQALKLRDQGEAEVHPAIMAAAGAAVPEQKA